MNTQEEWQKSISELENALAELAQKQLLLAHAEEQSLPVKRQNLSELDRRVILRSLTAPIAGEVAELKNKIKVLERKIEYLKYAFMAENNIKE